MTERLTPDPKETRILHEEQSEESEPINNVADDSDVVYLSTDLGVIIIG